MLCSSRVKAYNCTRLLQDTSSETLTPLPSTLACHCHDQALTQALLKQDAHVKQTHI
jgi:hypothetical protein